MCGGLVKRFNRHAKPASPRRCRSEKEQYPFRRYGNYRPRQRPARLIVDLIEVAQIAGVARSARKLVRVAPTLQFQRKFCLTFMRAAGKIILRMVRKTAHNEIAKALQECLAFVGGHCPDEIRLDMDVIHEWDLQSEQGVELACELSGRLSIDIPVKDNPLIEENTITGRKRSRSFAQVVEHIAQLANRDPSKKP